MKQTALMMAFLAVTSASYLATAAEPNAKPKQAANGATRTEHDLLGDKQVPANAYYGVQTARALENFQISGVKMNTYPEFVDAFAIVKLAAARANTEVGAMKPERLAAIEKAYEAVMAGKYHDQFLVDWYQGGAGTSANMNANEVLANIGLELTGHKKGRVPVPRAARRSQHVAVDQRLVPDRDQGRVPPAQRQADRRADSDLRPPFTPRATSTSRSRRWAAPSCRTRCR